MVQVDAECDIIYRDNSTFLESQFNGIPENLLTNFVISLIMMILFLILKAVAWNQRGKSLGAHEMGWIPLLFKDVYDFIPVNDLRRNKSIYRPLNEKMRFIEMMWFSFYKLTNNQILERCGLDAVEYLRFLKYTIKYSAINTFLALFCILPANFQGNMQRGHSLFVKTTMGNLDFAKSSHMLWIHVCVAAFLTIVCLMTIRRFILKLNAYTGSILAERTVLVKEIGKSPLTLERVKNLFKHTVPAAEITDIKFVYKYRRLIHLNKRLKAAKEALRTCRHIMEIDRRRVYVKESYWCCFYCFDLPPCKDIVDGEIYYQKKIEFLKQSLAEELRNLPSKMLRYAFVTFKNEYSAFQARNLKKAYSDYEDAINWRVANAPDPASIIWENVKREGSNLAYKNRFINGSVFLIAVFLTSPTIILSSSKLKEVTANLETQSAVISRFLPTLIVWSLSVAISALVTYSSEFLDFETKSALDRSIMLKSVTFLIFTVIILPSLGLTSISAFIIWAGQGASKYKWWCIFLPDNGSFFVAYVMTSAFIGTIIQLLRLPEIIFYVFYVLRAKSEAEKIAIRKSCIWDFSFGVQYSHALLIFTLVMFYTIPCPVIAPFGLLYFSFRFVVDRYNLFFASSPSRSSYRVHFLAMQFVIFSLIMQNIGLFFLAYIRAGFNVVSYSLQTLAWLTVTLCVCILNPCNLRYPPGIILGRRQEVTRPFHDYCDEERAVEPKGKKEIFHPFALRKFVGLLEMDEYDNPLPSRKRGKLEDSEMSSTQEESTSCSRD